MREGIQQYMTHQQKPALLSPKGNTRGDPRRTQSPMTTLVRAKNLNGLRWTVTGRGQVQDVTSQMADLYKMAAIVSSVTSQMVVK